MKAPSKSSKRLMQGLDSLLPIRLLTQGRGTLGGGRHYAIAMVSATLAATKQCLKKNNSALAARLSKWTLIQLLRSQAYCQPMPWFMKRVIFRSLSGATVCKNFGVLVSHGRLFDYKIVPKSCKKSCKNSKPVSLMLLRMLLDRFRSYRRTRSARLSYSMKSN